MPAAGQRCHVRLLDVSRADAPATVLAEQKTTLIGMSVPVPFELKVEPRMFLPQATYTVYWPDSRDRRKAAVDYRHPLPD